MLTLFSHRVGPILVVVIASGLWTAVGLAESDTPMWPPEGVSSPGEVRWISELTELRQAGVGRFLRAVAGESQQQSSWRFRRPTAVAVHQDRMAVVDGGSGIVMVADLDGRKAKKFDLPDGFLPVAVTVSHDGATWFVVDALSSEIRLFDHRGKPSGTIQPLDEVARCAGIAAAENGDLLLTDVETGRVLRMAPDGRIIARVGERGIEPGQFNHPTAITEAPDGTVWVLDALNFRVQHLDAELRPLGLFGTHGNGSGQLALPTGMTVDPDGHVYVADAQFDLIQLFDGEGRLLLAVGGRGGAAGQFWSPAGLACDHKGSLVVADTGNRRIQLLEYRRRSGGE